MRQPVHRNHENVVLDPFDAPHANNAHDAQGPVARPPSPAPRQPRRLLAHPSQMASVVGSRLRLDRFLPPVWSSRAPFVVRFARAAHAFSARVSVRLPCCTSGVAFSRQQVVLPGGQAYWTVLDGDFEVAEPFDGFLRWLCLVNGRAESTTRQYASAFAEWANWLGSVGERDDLVRWAERLGAFRFHLMTNPVSRPGSGCGQVRSPERVDGVLAAIRSFYRYAVARRLVAGSVNDLLYEVVEAGGPRVAWMEDPPARIARPLHRRRGAAQSEVISYVSLSEFEAMLAAPGSLRDKLLICLLGLEGIRVEEAVTLRRGQMHLMESSRELGCPVPGPHCMSVGRAIVCAGCRPTRIWWLSTALTWWSAPRSQRLTARTSFSSTCGVARSARR